MPKSNIEMIRDHRENHLKQNLGQSMVIHDCNPSNSRGGNRRFMI
jgi:hypothetical protein